MNARLAGFVSLHPYFKVHTGKLSEFIRALPALMAKTSSEPKNLFYEFSVHGDEVFCREGYADANALLVHLGNVRDLLTAALKIADLIRVEVHGPSGELDKLRGPLAHLQPTFFHLEN